MKKGKIKTQPQRLEEESRKSQIEVKKIDKLIQRCDEQISKLKPFNNLKELYEGLQQNKKALMELRQKWTEHPSRFKGHQLLISRCAEDLPADKKEKLYQYIGVPEKKITKKTPKSNTREELERLAFDINTDDKTAKRYLNKLLKLK